MGISFVREDGRSEHSVRFEMTRNIGAANGNFKGGFSSRYVNPDFSMLFGAELRNRIGLIGDEFIRRGGRGLSPAELDIAIEEMERRGKDHLIPSRRRLNAMKRQAERRDD